MNILVIGNGFDLAHGLPTRYSDFLDFIELYMIVYEIGKEKIVGWENSDNLLKIYIASIFIKQSKESNKIKSESNIFLDIQNNIWLQYFKEKEKSKKSDVGWIDFEKEISKMIKYINQVFNKNNEETKWYKKNKSKLFDNCDMDFFNREKKYDNVKKLLEDLNILIRCLELYLSIFINKTQVIFKQPDIDNLKIDKILNFNYTNTYERVYGINHGNYIEYNYIHRKADFNNTIGTNNMVLGIDEYLPEDRKNVDVEFIEFKKFYQRIYKGTESKYKKWVDDIKGDYLKYLEEKAEQGKVKYSLYNDEQLLTLSSINLNIKKLKKHNVYIFGHSLDVTDGDVLRELILNDNVYTTIFYPDKKELGRKIVNLVKVIGQDELIRRTGRSTKTIEFKQQQDMVRI